MIRVVSFIEAPDTVARCGRFELIGGHVHAEYFDDDFRELVQGWTVTPAHGREFIDELDRVFRRSSRILVETGP